MAFYNKEKKHSFGGPRNFEKRGPREGGFDRDDRGGRGSFGGRPGRTEMFDATCSECGKECQVPFRPNGRKPVLCSVCFGKSGGASSERRPERSFGRPSFGDRDDRHSRGPREFSPRPAPQENLKEQFDKLSNKLDRIIDLLIKKEAPTPKLELDLTDEEDFSAPVVKKVKKVAKTKKK